jgi:hypothetical protein
MLQRVSSRNAPMSNLPVTLLLAPDPHDRIPLATELRHRGVQVVEAASVTEACGLAEVGHVDVVVAFRISGDPGVGHALDLEARLQATPGAASLPLVLLSPDAETIAARATLSAALVLPDACEVDDLVSVLADLGEVANSPGRHAVMNREVIAVDTPVRRPAARGWREPGAAVMITMLLTSVAGGCGSQRRDINDAHNSRDTGHYRVLERQSHDDGTVVLHVLAQQPEHARQIADDLVRQTFALSPRAVRVIVAPARGGSSQAYRWDQQGLRTDESQAPAPAGRAH